MSITLQSGTVWSTNEVITALKLNNMLDEATAFGMVTGDMATGYRLADVATSEPAATDGYPWIDATGQLRFGNGTFFEYGSGLIRRTNKSGGTLVLGDVVRIDFLNSDAVTTIAPGTDPPASVFAVCQETILADAAGFFMYRGITKVNINSITNFITDAFTDSRGSGLFVETTTPAKACDAGTRSITPSQRMAFFGYLLDNPPFTGAGFVPGTYFCKVWR